MMVFSLFVISNRAALHHSSAAFERINFFNRNFFASISIIWAIRGSAYQAVSSCRACTPGGALRIATVVSFRTPTPRPTALRRANFPRHYQKIIETSKLVLYFVIAVDQAQKTSETNNNKIKHKTVFFYSI